MAQPKDSLYVPKALATKLQAVGFNYECTHYYPQFTDRALVHYEGALEDGRIPCPLWQVVLDWFREEWELDIDIKYIRVKREDKRERAYYWLIKFGNVTTQMTPDPNQYIFYYAALTAAVEEAVVILQA